MVAVGVQSNVDFGLQLLGLAVPITFIAATLLYGSLRESGGRPPRRVRALRIAQLASLTAVAGMLLGPHTRSLEEDHRRLARVGTAELALAREIAQRHPLDYLAYAHAAEAMLRTGDPKAVSMLNHALRLHPTHPGLHRLAGRILLRHGHRSQARLEYELALRHGSDPALLREVVAAFTTPEEIAAAIPIEIRKPNQLLRELESLGRDDVALAWLVRVADARPSDTRTNEQLHALAVARGDLATAELALRRRLVIAPSQRTRLALAELLAKRGAHEEVITHLEEVSSWAGRREELIKAWLLLCDARIALADWDRGAECVRRLDARGLLPDGRQDEVKIRLQRINDRWTAASTTSPAHDAAPITPDAVP
jgi:Flp pilus assembly protein TadD